MAKKKQPANNAYVTKIFKQKTESIMPFINERLSANQTSIDKARYEKPTTDNTVARQSRFHFNPEDVMNALRTNIIGQDDVLSSVEEMLYLVKADFGIKHRPLAVNLFLGPTGVGKTETVKIIAKSILGSTDNFCRIDMNTLAQEHYAASLTGAPPGYVGSKEGHSLFDSDAIKGSFSKPGIVLFDEIEKASTEVIRALLNVLDTGHLVLSSGTHEIDFSNALIFMTSNIGVKELNAHRAAQNKGIKKWFGSNAIDEKSHLKQALQKKFDPEFLNRIDRILSYDYLSDEFLDKILDVELETLNLRLKAKNATLELDETARQQLYTYYDEEYGARNLAQHIRVKLEPLVAREILKDDKSTQFIIEYIDDNFSISPNNNT
ncbi:AAA family ATPase [uncultured Cocleimonas sp.]|uniref:AAA family ATPase n=1 Tax=uncultured Cocleimonas sp. TaxID=1051587 RepID=UPI0026150FCB|nr:AAA family ATPase [uncultured Cocleimonas sp.]